MKQSAETESGRKFQYENGTRPNPGQGLRIGNDYIEGCYHCHILVRLFGCIGASPYDKAQMMKAIDWLQMGPNNWLCQRCKDDPMARASAPQRSGRAPLAKGFLPVDGNGQFAGFPPGFGGAPQNDQQQQPQPQQFAPPQAPQQQFAPPQQPQQLQPGAPPAGYPQPQGAPQQPQPPQQFQQPGAPPPQGYPQPPQQPQYAPPPQQPGYPPQQQFAPAPQPPPQQQPQYAPPQMQAPYPPQQQQPGYAPPQAPMAYAPPPQQQQAYARAPYTAPPRRARNDWRAHSGNPAGQPAPLPPRHVNLVANPVEGQEPDLARARAIASGDPNAPQPALPGGMAPTLPAGPDPSQSSAPPQE